MFKAPSIKTQLAENHPPKKWDMVPVQVKLQELLSSLPGTRVHGQELVPFKKQDADKLGDAYADKRHRDLTSEEIERYTKMRPSRLWRHYGEDDKAGRYAPNVPHIAVITPDGRIPPEFLQAKAASILATVARISATELLSKALGKEAAGVMRPRVRPIVPAPHPILSAAAPRPVLPAALPHPALPAIAPRTAPAPAPSGSGPGVFSAYWACSAMWR